MRTALLASLSALALGACNPKDAAPAADAAATPTAATAAGSLTLGADQLPRFKPGVWEVTQTGDGETEVTRHCVGEEASAELREAITRNPPECRIQRSVTTAAIKVDGVCDQPGGQKTETHMTLTGSQNAYEMKLGIYLIQPNGQRDGSDTLLKAKFTGQACPAGVNPGDEIE